MARLSEQYRTQIAERLLRATMAPRLEAARKKVVVALEKRIPSRTPKVSQSALSLLKEQGFLQVSKTVQVVDFHQKPDSWRNSRLFELSKGFPVSEKAGSHRFRTLEVPEVEALRSLEQEAQNLRSETLRVLAPLYTEQAVREQVPELAPFLQGIEAPARPLAPTEYRALVRKLALELPSQTEQKPVTKKVKR